VPEAVATPAGGAAADRAAVLAHLREMYAEALEYPVEAVTEDVELEAELGVDSVKQTELMARVLEHYGLPARRDGFRLAEYDTLGKVADLVCAALSVATTASTAPPAVAA
jgi:acyl carrier protein